MLDPNNSEAMVNSDVVAVVDTNVLMDIYLCHDLAATYERLGTEQVDAPEAAYRRARARESLLLAIYLHERAAETMSISGEPLKKILQLVPPTEGNSFTMHYTTIFVNFVREVVLSNWRAAQPSVELELEGNAADAWLLTYAKENSLPLITNEGYGTLGLREEKLRKRARDGQVEVFAPAEFYEGKLDEQKAIDSFLERFRSGVPEHLRKHPKRDVIRESFIYAEGYLRHILLGDTEGRDVPVVVRVR